MSKSKDQDPFFQGMSLEQQQNILRALVQHKMMLQALEKEFMPDPLTKLMEATGIPFTRKNYLEIMGLIEPLSTEVEAQIPKGLK